jgi:uncharacterized protein with FMN-binding domain
MKKAVTAVLGTVALAAPYASAAGAAVHHPKKHKAKPKKKVVTVKRTVAGEQGFAGRWGVVQVTLVVKKTTTILGKKKTIKRQVVGLHVPVYPDHTNRSVFINQQALPMLEQEVLSARYTANINMISGATDTSDGFIQSLQSALVKAKHV